MANVDLNAIKLALQTTLNDNLATINTGASASIERCELKDWRIAPPALANLPKIFIYYAGSRHQIGIGAVRHSEPVFHVDAVVALIAESVTSQEIAAADEKDCEVYEANIVDVLLDPDNLYLGGGITGMAQTVIEETSIDAVRVGNMRVRYVRIPVRCQLYTQM